jgi:8-oxo-dGTP pyrophosphatase MutT (NUDIX family)
MGFSIKQLLVNMILPANSIIVSGPVIVEKIDGKMCVLLNKHKPTPEKPNPKWQFCGGTMEDFDTSLEETAKRETMEEMGIDIEIEKLFDVSLAKRDDNSVAVLVHYLAKRISEIKPGAEIDEWNWFPINELPENCAPNIKPVIEKLKNNL